MTRKNIAFYEVFERTPGGILIPRELVLNTIPDEGQEHLLKLAFQDVAQTALFMALHTATLTELSTMASITGEPSPNGYARATITRDATDWTIAKNIASDHSGTATAGAAGTITLAAGASAVDDFYNRCVIELTGATGQGQFRLITDYVGSTKVATVSPNWKVNPDATTTYTVHSDFVVTSKDCEFSASGGSWGPVTKLAIVTVLTGTAGKIISFGNLASSMTPSAGQSFIVRWREVLRSGL